MSGPIAPGARVRWESQSMGTWKEKEGTVVAFVPAGKDVVEALREQGLTLPPGFSPDAAKGQRISTVDRYLVAVPRRHKRTKQVDAGQAAKVDYYLPRASVLKWYRSKST